MSGLGRTAPLHTVLTNVSPAAWRFALAVGAGSLAAGSGVALTVVAAWLVSRAAQHPSVVELTVAIVAVRALGISRGVMRYVERLASHDVALRGAVKLRCTLYERLSAARPGVLAALRHGEVLSRLTADVDAVADVVVRGLLPIAVAVVVGTTAVVFLATVLPWAAVVLAAALLVVAAAAPSLVAVTAGRQQQAADASRVDVAGQVHTVLEGATELVVAGALTARLSWLAATETRRGRQQDGVARPAAHAAAVQVLATGAAVVGCLVLGSAAVARGRLDPVLLAVVCLTPLAVLEGLAGVPAAAVAVARATGAATRLAELLGAEPTSAASAAPTAPALGAHLTLTDVAAGWPGGPATLDGVVLDVGPGQVLAVVGPSGSGKSTLLQTMAGLIPPRHGVVALGGVPVTQIAPDAYRRTVTLTADDAHVFATSVRDNLLVARGDATDAQLWAALRATRLDGWAGGLARGLATQVDAGSLSGGERRRLLLARALLVPSRVMLLDEPTEHLDPGLADEVLQDVVHAVRGSSRSLVVVTHRTEALRLVDVVVHVEGGRVTAQPNTGHRDRTPLRGRTFGS